ncbi:2-oxoacid:acceptor oxidoreductase family protein [Rhodocyclus purpureus]|uniref:2-oxoacid:acceptor oxidoreductase family protein n=1 Tax=Rhodocyclus purpureus TaxID=1067 RepID=UPI0019135D34|nr:2-oxoacid:acceptor oxidoreductase family protein [Rhodocyclus purpureus]MBK5914289.1 hypothetical protein [Rhodocyclus purpureus]
MLLKALRALFVAEPVVEPPPPAFSYPGIAEVADGEKVRERITRAACDAVVECTSAAGAAGRVESAVHARPAKILHAESEHAAAGVLAGLALSGLRAGAVASGGGVAFLHESLYAAAGKRLPYVLNVSCRGMGAHPGDAHDDYHGVADSGVIQLLARNVQEIADFNLIAHRIAELSLTPALVGHDAAATTQAIESLRFPEAELIADFLGRPDDEIDTPTVAQAKVFGARRRRIPSTWDVDAPLVSGVVQNQDAYMQATAAQRPYFFEHIPAITDACMDEYERLTGRRYRRVGSYLAGDAEYLIVAMGSLAGVAEGVADHLRRTRGLRVGVVNVTMFRPFPGDLVAALLQGKRGVTVLERSEQPLAEDGPLMREIRACLGKCLENGSAAGALPHPGYAAYRWQDLPALFSGHCGPELCGRLPGAVVAAIDNMLSPDAQHRRFVFASSGGETAGDRRALPLAPNPEASAAGVLGLRIDTGSASEARAVASGLARVLAREAGTSVKGLPLLRAGAPATGLVLAFADTPLRVDAGSLPVDVLIAADSGRDLATLAQIRAGGALVVSSRLPTPAAIWDSFPVAAQAELVDRRIRLFHLDAEKIAREVAESDAGSAGSAAVSRLQACVLQGAFLAAASDWLGERRVKRDALLSTLAESAGTGAGDTGFGELALSGLRRGCLELAEIRQKTLGFGRGGLRAAGTVAGAGASAPAKPEIPGIDARIAEVFASAVDSLTRANVAAFGERIDALRARIEALRQGSGSADDRLAALEDALAEVRGRRGRLPAPLCVDSTALALGVFEGHMAQLAEDFKTVRRAEFALSAAAGEPGSAECAAFDEFLKRFDWSQFSDEEWALCPPVVAVGSPESLSESRLQSLSRLLMSGKPVKVLVQDDLSAGVAGEASKEIGLIALAHRTAFVLQSSPAHPEHLAGGFVDGLKSRRPALFRIHSPSAPAHDTAAWLELSRQAVASRVFPLFSYDPDAAALVSAALSLAGNPAPGREWATHALAYLGDDGSECTKEVPLTGADLVAGQSTELSPLADDVAEALSLDEYLHLPAEDREGITPCIWAVDGQRRLVRRAVSPALVARTEAQLRWWQQLAGLAGSEVRPLASDELVEQVRDELLAQVLSALAA